MSKPEADCTKKCKSRTHGQILTSAITKRSISDASLASFIKATCANFTKAFDFEGRTALHMSVSRGRNELMHWLIKHSSEAFINAKDRESGYTPLHRSIFYGQIHSAVSLIKIGVYPDILDKDDYKAFEHAMLDRQYICKVGNDMPNDVYVWGSNSNYTLGTGSHQPKNMPDLLTCFSRTNEDIRQVCLGKFHSVFLSSNGSVWSAGQPSRAGGTTATALRPILVKLHEPCRQVALTLTSTVFLLQSGVMYQYSSTSSDNTNPGSKVATTKYQISNPIGVCAGRSHGVLWNARGVYTWGINLGQLGHQAEDKVVPTPKKVAISINNKEETKFELVDASDAATVISTSRGDVYLLHKYICKKIAVKQINLHQVCVEAKVSETGTYSRVTVLLLTNVGQLMIWQDTTNRLTRCVFGLTHQVKITQVALTHDALYFTTKYGEAFIGHISRKTTPTPIQPIRKEKEKDSGKTALVKFLEKDDCTSVKIIKIPNIHRATAIAVDYEGLNFACLQNKPTCGLLSLPELSPTGLSKHMESLVETASEDDLLHDVIFKIGSKLFPAHMFIVASSSELLYNLYQEAKATNINDEKPIICLENVLPEVFERILKYMYTGSCDVAEPGPCGLKIRKEDVVDVKKERDVDVEEEVIENPSEISAFEVYKTQDKRKNNKRRQNGTNATPRPPKLYCDPVKLVQTSAKKLQVMGLHKLLEKFYYKEDSIRHRESSSYTKNPPLTWDRDSFPELVDTNVCSKDGVLISAHKCVLAARLEYFHGMFMHSWTESKLLSKVTIPINHGILLPVINFLYTDACPEIQKSDSIDFICSMLIVSDQLFIGRLREMCEVALANLITLKNCAELCQFAHTYNATQLKQCCMEYISLNLANILENRALDPLEEELLEDISKYYCKFNPIMSSRIITPFSIAPSDETIEECANNYPVDLDYIDEEYLKDSSIVEVSKKKTKSKKIEYTESEKARMRYESVSSVTSLDLNDTSGDITLSLKEISKETVKSTEKTNKWTEVLSPQQKQQKVVQARLKAISAAKEILNEAPANTFTKLTKNNSSTIIPELNSPTTSRMSTSPQESTITELVNRNSHCNLVISHVGPKLSQKQRKKLAANENGSVQTLDTYLANKLNVGSPPDKPKNPWKICEAPVASSSPKLNQKSLQFDQILADQKKQKDDSSRIMSKPLTLTQLEDKAIEDLERFYNIHEVDDELITVKRIELQVSSPQWIHTAPK
ncbi:inhibitor of Bruton tyrosine kinase [Colias croceus]|uniref:inhibitor of Bruton tyrosine kinase n=1 Tax=Colias crocea TaxID=72248 RepID=UPI001E27EC1C|nr:inhibitor of Bruton tyrosine kinase [Colias croceus]